MDIKRALTILDSMVLYAQYNWNEDAEDDLKELKEAVKVVKSAVKKSKVVGNLTIKNKNYFISESEVK